MAGNHSDQFLRVLNAYQTLGRRSMSRYDSAEIITPRLWNTLFFRKSVGKLWAGDLICYRPRSLPPTNPPPPPVPTRRPTSPSLPSWSLHPSTSVEVWHDDGCCSTAFQPKNEGDGSHHARLWNNGNTICTRFILRPPYSIPCLNLFFFKIPLYILHNGDGSSGSWLSQYPNDSDDGLRGE